jgi:hypothetical protein
MPIKTFRGLMQDNTQDTISLHTNNGAIGYRIKTFKAIPQHPSGEAVEGIFKIYTVEQAAVDEFIDLSDQTLIAALYLINYDNPAYAGDTMVLNDNATFNQDIYITFSSKHSGNHDANYYIELEQISLDVNERTVATLKDIRNVETQG